MRRIIFTLCVGILASCTTQSDRNFCQNWATDDGSGFSEEWFPTATQMQFIQKDIVQERDFICAVKNPSGKVSVITTYEKSGYRTLSYQLKNDKLIFIHDEEQDDVLVGGKYE